MMHFVQKLILTALISTSSVLAQSDNWATKSISATSASAAINYWTIEKMQSASPMPYPILDKSRHVPAMPTTQDASAKTDKQPAISPTSVAPKEKSEEVAKLRDSITQYICEGNTSCTTFLPDEFRDLDAHIASGKVFFTLFGFNFFCSAAAAATETAGGPGNRQLVLTAGHCLNDGSGTFATSFVFVPAYNEGEAPYGIWPATNLFTTPEWNTGFGLAFSKDVGFARIALGTGDYAGEKLHNVVGAYDIEFNPPELIGKKIASSGYGIDVWGGERPVITLGTIDRFDPNFSPNPPGVPSEHTGGSSGGPWLSNYLPRFSGSWGADKSNVIIGINAYVNSGSPVIYSPQMTSDIQTLWALLAQQP